jgi:cytochrome bd-type quinol oxidase subunit 2
MATLIIIFVLLIALSLVARRWGFDSREKIDSSEWQRRVDRTGSSIY